MTIRSIGGLAAAVLFLGCTAFARAANVDPCWELLYQAMEHSAAAPHSPFITYSELIHITQDGHRYEFANANVTYRDDGLAYIDDDRWVHPFFTRVLEPGPPVLGPYGAHRASWLSFDDTVTDETLPVIADTRNYRHVCIDQGDETIDGRPAAHLVIPDAPEDRAALKAIWIDRKNFEVRRAIVSQWITFLYDYSGKRGQKLIDYTIAVQNINGYNVIRQVNWEYTYRVFSQFSTISAEYVFDAFHFDTKSPLGTAFDGSLGYDP
ncbi:MAG: hypothetical protein JO322_11095 [Candidatus Eremiobacteraeota bacterium]|nr:hypothetical protein [Candidatus Eremiobacteraeota bacterium]